MKGFFYYLILPILFLASCSDDKDDQEPPKKFDTVNETLNNWTYEQMNTYYYWYNNLPTSSSLRYTETPKNFYKSLLYTADRFSYMDYQSLSSRSQTISTYDPGFHYMPFSFTINGETWVVLFVTYVKPGTTASLALKRGDLVTAINGKRLITNNYEDLLTSGTILKLTINYADDVTIFINENYQENPLLLSETLEINDKKIGYVVYNHFANGPENADYSWAVEVNNALTKFKNDGITELILDLRYNRGGYVESGTYIASAIAPNRSGKIYTKSRYNDKLEKNSNFKNRKNNYFSDYIKNGKTKYDIPQLNLSRIIVITGYETASASEQIINGLRAYIDVEVLGETTVGKNQESFELSYDGSEAILSLHPIVAITYRSNVDDPAQNDYSAGFEPTIGVLNEELDEITRGRGWIFDSKLSRLYTTEAAQIPLGDTEETLLKIALKFIETGDRSPESEVTTTRSSEIITPKKVVDKDAKFSAILTKIVE